MAVPILVPILAGTAFVYWLRGLGERKEFENLPGYAQPKYWPKSTNLDEGLTGMSLLTFTTAIKENSDPAALREAADMAEGYGWPIAAERLDEKADMIMRLKRDGYI